MKSQEGYGQFAARRSLDTNGLCGLFPRLNRTSAIFPTLVWSLLAYDDFMLTDNFSTSKEGKVIFATVLHHF